jgi:predicted nucleic acid-binding protein
VIDLGSCGVVLADAGPFCRLAEAGETVFDIAAEFLRAKVQIVEDVNRELRRRSGTPAHNRLHRLGVIGVPPTEPISITDSALLSRIETILEGRRALKPGHPLEDRGEIATVLVAASEGLPVLMDDGFGRRFAAREGVAVFTTQDLAIELVARELCKPLHAWPLHRLVNSVATRKEFEEAAAALKANLP